ncbi:dTDP-4-dehydrorhamnose reductase [Paenibacillus sp. 1P07SE]|uniref:dTDP-4-dehydrorhamnose reductase n=1 Tax=Paenibacillus sp. 1P07SE TaxID=3132209 RepID=UPI0039A4C09B
MKRLRLQVYWMLKVLVTGGEGQLGRDLVSLLQAAGYDVEGPGRDALDVTRHEAVREWLQSRRPDIIVHSAAYTDVDGAERAIDTAWQVNSESTRNLAAAAEALGAKLVYISTDYVFGSSGHTLPYEEATPVDPINVYGQTKASGEAHVQNLHTRHFIIRTSWMYGRHGRNFVKTMLELAKGDMPIQVVDDQVGSPTWTEDVSRCILRLIATEKYGIYHVTNAGSCSWHEFAAAIFELSGIDKSIQPVSSAEFPRAARRPAYSVLAHSALAAGGFPPMRHWRDALTDYLA